MLRSCYTIIIKKRHPLAVLLLFLVAVNILGGCSFNMTNYYVNLTDKMNTGDYKSAAKLVEKTESKYGSKNILMYYLDSGIVNHYALNFEKSVDSFEKAKEKFDDYYQKSISAGAASIVFNDSTMPYYGQDFERTHIAVFEALNFILQGKDVEAAVEARQINTLFNVFAVQKKNKNFYKDDGFIRYFMGLVYENAGELNDAQISYYLALKAYKDGIVAIAPPKDLINDAYTTALNLGFTSRANEIKSMYPSAKKVNIPKGYGECIIINYNGFIPKKIEKVFNFALFDIWPYINEAEIDNDKEQQEFERAKNIIISGFANDYVKVSFPKYQRIPNSIKTFSVEVHEKNLNAYLAQNLSQLAEKVMDDEIAKIYAKTLARAAVKYALGKVAAKTVKDQTDNTWGAITQIGFNLYSSLSETADRRGWNTLPDTIQMLRFMLPEGENTFTVVYKDDKGNIIEKEDVKINIREGKKNFIYLRSSR